jgi:Na+/H+-dicarboxylate symporter
MQNIITKTKPYHSAILYLVMILLGIFSGLSDVGVLKNFGLLVSDIFIKIFRCISLPIVALSLIVTLSSYSADRAMSQVWKRAIMYTLGTTLVAAMVSCGLYLLIQPPNANVVVASLQAPAVSHTGYSQYMMSLIPANIFSPFLEHQVMGVLLIGIVVGIAIRYIPEAAPRLAVIHFFQGIHGLFLVITKWVVAILPLGLFGFITTTVVQLRSGINISGIGKYLLVLVLANLIQGFIILPLWLRFNKIKPFETMRKMLPALSIAFFSKSSAGTLPVTMATAEKNLHIDSQVSRFILPLCTNINMNGCAAFIFVTVIYLMQNHGIPITFGMMGLWIVISTIAAIGNAGVPMGCFFLSASLLASMDVPITLLGIILPFYSIIDMIETSLNVWSDSCVAKVIHEKLLVDREVVGELVFQ